MPNQVSLVIAIALLLCSCTPDNPKLATQYNDHVMYMSADGFNNIRCSGGEKSQFCAHSPEMGAERSYRDCSNDEFNCIANSAGIMAIPKTKLSADTQYSLHDTTFRVEFCAGPENDCKGALISSKCATQRACECKFGSDEPRTTYFYYNGEKGITSFFSVATTDDLRNPENITYLLYSLQEQTGFLRKQISLPRLDFPPKCINTPEAQ